MKVNLTELRLNRGLSVREAAKQMGVGPDTLTRAEEGTMPRPDSALKVANFYELRVTDVWPLPTKNRAAAA